jgi:membrane glycosyltransferase
MMKILSLDPRRITVFARRTCFALLVMATTALISERMFGMLQINGLTPLKLAIFVLFVILLLPIALSFWTSIIGFIVQCLGGDSLDLGRTLDEDDKEARPLPRTAIVMPIFNEDPVRVFAGLKASYESLQKEGRLETFDFFVLSDTTDPDIWVREELAFAELKREVSQPDRFFYRNRRENVDRKSGNIGDFCATWGERYEYLIVFDADSIMSAKSLVNLVRIMEKNPKVGIVQAPPLPVNRRTLFGRLHQFAMHAYSQIFITGLNFWQGGAANYWGHNAIIRIRPFWEHCRLPKLSGQQPLGGSILSHDFVEAAFMRRAGWRVYLASELRGSYEELPSSLINYAARDRRWCQGNLQHARLLFTPGLHIVNRIHLLMGVMSYVASPLWLLLLALTTTEGLIENLGKHTYFLADRVLFPDWQISTRHQAFSLFVLMLSLLLIPKFLSVAFHVANKCRAADFGGRAKLALSVVLEMVGSTLLAPNLALLQSRFVVGTLMGKSVKWDSQDRSEAGTSFKEAFRRHWWATALGIVWGALLWLTVPKLFWWFAPVIGGFLLAIPFSVWSSRTNFGEWAKRHNLFLIRAELSPPSVLRELHQELERASQRQRSNELDGLDGLSRVLEDSEVRQLHLGLLPPGPPEKDPMYEHHIRGLELKLLYTGSQALTKSEKRELLLSAESIRRLRPETTAKEVPAPDASQPAVSV